jgi:hypothetical protein
MKRLTLLAAAAWYLAAAPAHAASWSRPPAFSIAGTMADEAAPRVAIARDGTNVAAWWEGSRIAVSAGDRRGRFSRPEHAGTRPGDIAVAAAPGGRAVVAWEDRDAIWALVRDRRGGDWRRQRLAVSTGSAINGITLAADPRGGWVLAERQFPARASGDRYVVRTLSLRADGTPIGTPQDLGRGTFAGDARPDQALTVDAQGTATLVLTRPAPAGPRPVFVTRRPHGGTFAEPRPLPGDRSAEPRVAALAGGAAAVAFIRPDQCGEVGCLGLPMVGLVGADGTVAAPVAPPLGARTRAFGPWVTPVGSGLALVFQEGRTGPFSREAPVRAVIRGADGRFGAVQDLSGVPAAEPVALPLDRGRALVLWTGRRFWGAAVAGADGRFTRTRAPGGPAPAPYHTNRTNRDVRTAGRYAIAGWVRKGRIRLTVRAF